MAELADTLRDDADFYTARADIWMAGADDVRAELADLESSLPDYDTDMRSWFMEEIDYNIRTANRYRARADEWMAGADEVRADLADWESLPHYDTDYDTDMRSWFREEIDHYIRTANRFRAMADERMAESDRGRALSNQLGAQIPASESAIARVLKRVRVDADDKEDSEESEEEGGDRKRRKVSETETSCCVCLDEFKEGGLEVASMPCEHSFHHKCIATWLKRSPSCPLCRCQVILRD